MNFDLKKWRILLLDTKRRNPNHYLNLAVKRALESHVDVELIINPVLGEAMYLANLHRCNLFIAFDGEELHSEICRRLAKICGKSILWVTEDPYELAINKINSKFFDLVFSNNSSSVISYGEKGRHLPLAACNEMHYSPIRKNKECIYDLFFAGTAWPNRVDFIKNIMPHLEGIKTKIILPHNKHITAPKLGFPDSFYSWRISNSQFIQFANRSRVVLSLHREFTVSQDGFPIADTPGPRFFEIALAGGFQLVDMSLSESTNYFEEGKEFIGFTSPNDAVNKLQHYLHEPNERISIALAAQVRAHKEHLYQHRVSQMLREVEKISENVNVLVPLIRSIKVLQVTHNIVTKPPYGGIEVYIDWIRKNLDETNQIEIFFLVPENSGYSKKISLLDHRYKIIEIFNFQEATTPYTLSDLERENSFNKLLIKYQINIVHFQHLLGHVPSLPYIARALGVKTIISLHDYYTLCWQFNLINYEEKFCEPENLSETSCDICTRKKIGGTSGSQSNRRSFYGRVLKHIDVLIFNTEEVKRRYLNIYPFLEKKNQLVVNGVPIKDGYYPPKKFSSDPLRVVIIGNFLIHKGAYFFLELFEKVQDLDIQFEVIGTIDPNIPNDTYIKKFSNVKFRGGYKQDELGGLLTGASIALFASKWPETYCISLSEAWQYGLIPIAPRIGAFDERIEHGINGLKYDLERLPNLVELLRLLKEDKFLLSSIQNNISEKLYSTTSTHRQWLSSLYLELANKTHVLISDEPIKHGLELSIFDSGITLMNKEWMVFEKGLQNLSINTLARDARIDNIHITRNIIRKIFQYLIRHGVYAVFKRSILEIHRSGGIVLGMKRLIIKINSIK